MIDPALFEENQRTAPRIDERSYSSIGDFQSELGVLIPEVVVAYDTWGTINDHRDNAVLICHALTGDSYAIGWWDRLIGPGLPIDTDKFFVIGTNCLGGCQGTTGPASLHPDGKPWQLRFPVITIRDMVRVQKALLDNLGIKRLKMVAGGSMGGMQALDWSVAFPNAVDSVFVTASCLKHSPMQIGFNEVARQAIMRDPLWAGGAYVGDGPTNGLAVSRMLGHLSFLSDQAFQAKFGRRLQGKSQFDYHFGVEFEVESYLNYQGDKFTKRFDANSLLYLTRAIDYFDLDSLEGSNSRYLVVSFTSDWLYPTYQSVEIEQAARDAGCEVVRAEIDLPYGHDAFLLDGEQQGGFVREFLS